MTRTSTSKHAWHAAMALLTLAATPLVWAHGPSTATNHDKPKMEAVAAEQKAFGQAGDPQRVTRTIAIDMHDMMRFGPTDIAVSQGETIRFVVKNQGKIMHEMVLGTMAELKAHGELMKKHPGMEHDEAYMTHVSPGKAQEMLWRFTQAGEFHYACLLPGHMEAGMVGKITVKPGKEQS